MDLIGRDGLRRHDGGGVRRAQQRGDGDRDDLVALLHDGAEDILKIARAMALDPDALASASFSFSMDLAGTQTITFLPLARQTEVELSGNWADPSYSGAFLPANHSAAGSVFTT